MDSTRKSPCLSLFAALIVGSLNLINCFVPAAAAADPGKEAVVVGISRYADPQVSGFNKATENDVKLMKEALEKRGFHVTVLTNARATRAGIIAALSSYSARIDQFVLYYAGQSEVDVFNGNSWIDPYDSARGSRDSWLSAADLRAAVEAVPADSRTVIADTRAAGNLINAQGRKPVCYCVSSASREQAGVGQFAPDDEEHKIASHIIVDNRSFASLLGKEPEGIFTHFLARAIMRGNPDQTWAQLMDEVANSMHGRFGANQTPELTPEYAATRVFYISPLLLSGVQRSNVPAPGPIASLSTPATVAPAAPVPPAAALPAPAPTIPPPVTQPAEQPAPVAPKAFDAAASKRLVALWTGADGNPDEDKGRAMNVADVTAALKAGADPDANDAIGLTLLIIAAGTNRADIAKLALDAHCDINFKNDGLGTALVEAAYTGSVDVVKLLLARGADITATKEGGVTALGAAKSEYDGKSADTTAKIVKMLTDSGATN